MSNHLCYNLLRTSDHVSRKKKKSTNEPELTILLEILDWSLFIVCELQNTNPCYRILNNTKYLYTSYFF